MALEDSASPAPTTPGSTGEAAGANAFTAQDQTGAGPMGAFKMTQPGRVYYGSKPPENVELPKSQGERARGVGAGEDVWTTPSGAYEDFYRWTDKQRRDLTAAGVLSGQLRAGSGDIETAGWWKQLVDESAKYGAVGQKISPMDIAAGYVSASGQSGTKQRTVTSTRVDISDPMTAKSLTTTIFQQLLGRDPAPGELGNFAQALQAAEQAAPSTTTTTSQYDAQGNITSQSSQAQGGMTAEGERQLLADKVKGSSEYGVQQAATTYMDATKKAIWGAPGT